MAVSHKSDGILQGTKLINLCILGYCRRDFHTHTYVYIYTPWGKRLQFANLKMVIEIVDLPIDSMVIFHSYVSLPEGISFMEPTALGNMQLWYIGMCCVWPLL